MWVSTDREQKSRLEKRKMKAVMVKHHSPKREVPMLFTIEESLMIQNVVEFMTNFYSMNLFQELTMDQSPTRRAIAVTFGNQQFVPKVTQLMDCNFRRMLVRLLDALNFLEEDLKEVDKEDIGILSLFNFDRFSLSFNRK